MDDAVAAATRTADNLDEAVEFARPRVVDPPAAPQLPTIQCFAPDTLVATPSGLRPIGEMQAGDEVVAFDFHDGGWVVDHVAERHDNYYDGPVVKIATDSGSIETTVVMDPKNWTT